MKKLYTEVFLAILFVVGATLAVYNELAGVSSFWDAQFLWSIGLLVCWVIVSAGYFNQGFLVGKARTSSHVSLMLPTAVFIVQCILFVKGIFYRDWSLIIGAVMVNSGVTFSIYQILKYRKKRK